MKLYFHLFFLLSITLFSQSLEWKQTNGPLGGYITDLIKNPDGHVYAGTYSGLYISEDDGSSWNEIAFKSSIINCIAVDSSGHIFVACTDRKYRLSISSDNGNSWNESNFNKAIISLAIYNNYIFAGTGEGIFRSSDNGISWTEINNGLSNKIIKTIALKDSIIYIGTNLGLYKSFDKGENWNFLGGLYQFQNILVKPDGEIYASAWQNEIFRSRDDGITWDYLPLKWFEAGQWWHYLKLTINKMICDNLGNIYAATYMQGVFKSSDNGESWHNKTLYGLDDKNTLSLCLTNSNLVLAGSAGSGIYKLISNQWLTCNNGLIAHRMENLKINSKNELFASSSDGGGLFYSSDYGNTWSTKGLYNSDISSIAFAKDNSIYVGSHNWGVYRSTNNGVSWDTLKNDMPDTNVHALGINSKGQLFAGCGSPAKVYRSIDNGITWNLVASNLTEPGQYINTIYVDAKDFIYVGAISNKIFRSKNDGNNWEEITTGLSPSFFSAMSFTENKDGTLFVGSQDGVYSSTDNGTNWNRVKINDEPFVVFSIINFDENTLIVAALSSLGIAEKNGIFISTDSGRNWTKINTGLINNDIRSLAIDSNGNLFGGTTGDGVWLMKNVSKPTKPILSFPENCSVSLSVDLELEWTIIQNAEHYQILVSKDSLFNIITVNDSNLTINSIVLTGLNKGTKYFWKVRATNVIGQSSWSDTWNFTTTSEVPVELKIFECKLEKNIINLFWTTSTEVNNKGFVIEKRIDSNNWEIVGFVNGNGTTTEPKNYIFTDDKILSKGEYYYRLKQIDYDGTYTYSGEIFIEVNLLPLEYKVYQNYPNPFNPLTTIKYDLPEKNTVILKVLDILGTELTTLVNEQKQAGNYEVTFDGSNLPSGIYFYHLQAGKFSETKKLLLIK